MSARARATASVRLSAELVGDAHALRDELLTLLRAQDEGETVVDVSELFTVDLAAAQVLLAAKRMRPELRFDGWTPALVDLLTATGLATELVAPGFASE